MIKFILIYLTTLDHMSFSQYHQIRVLASPAHGDDLFYFFPHPAVPFPVTVPENEPLPEEIALSRTLVKMYTNFATCLDPTPMKTCEIQWEPFFPNHTYLHIGQTHMELKHHFLAERMEFWQSHEYPFKDDDIATPQCVNETYLSILTFIEEFSFE